MKFVRSSKCSLRFSTETKKVKVTVGPSGIRPNGEFFHQTFLGILPSKIETPEAYC